MKKIINGRKYDTDTAQLVAEWSEGYSSDFSHVEEELYRKRTGEYFLYGYGGPMSRYARRASDGNFTGGEEIMPLSYDTAREWAERHMDVDSYESEFGEVDESDEIVAVTVRISAAARTKLQRESSRTGESQADIVDRLIMSM